MKIALIGYGKMGKAIERAAIARGHEISVRIDADNLHDFDSKGFAEADIAIEFTTPGTAVDNYRRCFERDKKVVSGSTGWTARMDEVKEMCRMTGGTFFWTSNFSIGVNVFFALNRYLAKLMAGLPQYTPEMMEIHHIHKLDHPSGTAITLAHGIEEENPAVKGWTENAEEAHAAEKILINHRREGEVPGTHIVKWDSPTDSITIEHSAKSRDGFALGAVMAAEWAVDQKGVLTIDMFMHRLIADGTLLDILDNKTV